MATDNLRICSLNANSMRDHSKRAQLVTWLKIKNFDIMFLQQTHCNSNSDSKFVGKRVGRKLLLEFWREQIMQNVHSVPRGSAIY